MTLFSWHLGHLLLSSHSYGYIWDNSGYRKKNSSFLTGTVDPTVNTQMLMTTTKIYTPSCLPMVYKTLYQVFYKLFCYKLNLHSYIIPWKYSYPYKVNSNIIYIC